MPISPTPFADLSSFMPEMWLQTNRRALWFACLPPLFFALIGVWVAIVSTDSMRWTRWLGLAIIALGGIAIALLLARLGRARIAFEAGNLLFDLRPGKPIRVPVNIVEAFFLGQAPANLPAGVGKRQKTVNLVARLSQRETAWAEREVKPALGDWKDGYITIRGIWCEPLGMEVIRRLNRRLKEVQGSDRLSKAAQAGTSEN